MMRRIVEGTSRIISCDGSSILCGVVKYQIIIKCIPLALPMPLIISILMKYISWEMCFCQEKIAIPYTIIVILTIEILENWIVATPANAWWTLTSSLSTAVYSIVALESSAVRLSMLVLIKMVVTGLVTACVVWCCPELLVAIVEQSTNAYLSTFLTKTTNSCSDCWCFVKSSAVLLRRSGWCVRCRLWWRQFILVVLRR